MGPSVGLLLAAGPWDENELVAKAPTMVVTYEREDMCDSPANQSVGWRYPVFIHDEVRQNLNKGKRYYYQAGSDSGGWSKTYSFISRNEDSDETIAFMFGDMGTATPYNIFIRTKDESTNRLSSLILETSTPYFVSLSHKERLTKYVKGASVLVLGAFMGYVVGFISRSRRDAPPASGGSTWLHVKTLET